MASSSNATAVKGGSGSISTPANNVGGDRRSSSGSATNIFGAGSGSGLFSGLMNQKRNSTDAAAQARRQSFHDMKPEAGVIGKLWHNFTTGTGGK